MGYENAPATRMLATHCAACGRALVDAASVEAGMGPDCRSKYLGEAELDPDVRTLANARVHEIALALQAGDKYAIGAGTAYLRALGCTVLAERIEERTAAVRILPAAGDRIAAVTSYDERAIAAFRRIQGRRWDPAVKAWTFPKAQRAALWDALKHVYPGQLGIAERGPFVIPAT